MAYHFAAKVIGMATGSAVHRAAYQARTQLEDERHGRTTKDYGNRRDLAWSSAAFLPKDAPAWMQDRGRFWNGAEKAERQANGQPARDFELALPNRLTREQQIRLVTDFTREQFARKGFGAWANLHSDHDAEGKPLPRRDPADPRNDHLHLMVSTRKIGADGFAKTKTDSRAMNSKEQLAEWRETWAKQCARALRRAGHEQEAARWEVGHLPLPQQREAALARGDQTWADQLDREPDQKMGVAAAQMEARGIETEKGDRRRAIFNRNAERGELRQEAEVISLELARIEAQERQQRDERRREAETAAKLAKIEARRQGQARAAIRTAAIRLRELKDQRQETQARHDAAYVGRQEESQQFRQEREEGRKALYDRFQHAIDQVWNPEGGPAQASPDLSPLHQINERLNQNRAAFDKREGSAWGRVRNALDTVNKWPGASEMVLLILSRDARRKGFERQQRRLYAQLAPKVQPQKVTARPNTPSPKSYQSAKLKEMRREALAEYDRETKAGAATMQGRHQFQRSAETAEKAALRQAQAEAGAAMDAAKAMQGEAPAERREATTGQPIRSGADAISPGVTVEAGKAFRGHDPSAEQPEAIHGPPDGQDGHVAGGAGDPVEGKPSRTPATWTQEGQAGEDRVSAPEAEDQPPPQPDQARQRSADEQAEADRQALERLLARTDAEIAARDAEADAEQQRQAEQGGRERGF